MPTEGQEPNKTSLEKTEERDDQGHFLPGWKGGPGRPKGSKNHFSDLKTDYLCALEHLGKPYQQIPGNENLSPGAAYLVDFARKHPKTFVTGLVKLLPSTSKDEVTVQASLPPLQDHLPPKHAAQLARAVTRFEELRRGAARTPNDGKNN